MGRRPLAVPLVLGAALLAGAAAWRSAPATSSPPPARPATAAPAGTEEPDVLVAPLPEPEELVPDPLLAFPAELESLSRSREQRGETGYRAAVLRATSAYLGFDPATALAFEHAQAVSRAELAALQVRMSAAFAGLPLDLPDEELQRRQAEVEEEQRPDREAARARLEAFLGASPAHTDFRGRLEAWLDDLP